jgi:tetratricopeptide (TPR) repeat protein
MSFFARLMGSDPDSRIKKARKFLDRHDFSEARYELLELDHPDATALMKQALEGLILLNLGEAEACSQMGDVEGASEHMELARSFGASSDQIRAIRKSMREAREAERRQKVSESEVHVDPEGSDPLWGLEPDDPRLRFALMLETWPEGQRNRLANLGVSFAGAALLLEDGHPKEAISALTEFIEREPAARLFRARAQLALGNLPAAASDLKTLGDTIGHQLVGKQHSGVLLAQVLGQLGRLEEALAVVEEQSALLDEHDPVQLPLAGSRASLLEGLGQLEEAEEACQAVVLLAPRDLGLYRMLARIRVGLGNRMGAMQALEGGLSTCCSSPGKCGNQPFDVLAGRMLAQLYLEDRIEPKRTQELLEELQKNVQQPGWDDRYLATLVARNSHDPASERMAAALLAELGERDRRRVWVREQFQLNRIETRA